MGERKLTFLGMACFAVLILDMVSRQFAPQWFFEGTNTSWFFSISAAVLCGIAFYPTIKSYFQSVERFRWKSWKPEPAVISLVLLVYLAGPMLVTSVSLSAIQVANIPSMTLSNTQEVTELAVYAWQRAEKADARKAATFVIATEYAVAVPYRQENGKYTLASLTNSQIKQFEEIAASKAQANSLIDQNLDSFDATADSLIEVYTAFAVFLLTFMVMERKRGSSGRHQYHRYYWYAATLALTALYLLVEYGQVVQIRWVSIVLLCLTLPAMLLYNLVIQAISQGLNRINLVLCALVLMMQMIGFQTQLNHTKQLAQDSVFQPYYNATIRSALNALVNGYSENTRKQSAQALYHHLGLAVDYRNEQGNWETFKPQSRDVETYHDTIRQQRTKLVRFEKAYNEQNQINKAGVFYSLGLIFVFLFLLPLAKKYYQRVMQNMTLAK